MRIAFYAPLKPPDHPVPSGDRRMAQLLMAALGSAGHEPELAARLRTWDARGDVDRQMRLAGVGARLAQRIGARLAARPPAERPRAWLTYHLYHKAPDWLGPRIAGQLGIPYLVVEASLAGKREGGAWGLGHAATRAALERAAAVVSLNPVDEEGIAPVVRHRRRLHRLKPFLDTAPFADAARARARHRAALAARLNLPDGEPWLLAVAMMRSGDKLASFRLLGEALAGLGDRGWRLLVAGDGPVRAEVEAALAAPPGRAAFLGELAADDLPGLYAACDLLVWPAVNEAFGMAFLEAHAAALPAVAGEFGAVAEIVAHERTGLLAAPGDAASFAAAVAQLLDDPARRRAMGTKAWAKIAAEHALPAAGQALDRILKTAIADP